jgi:malonate decarboxylase gamma subunit
MGAVHVTWHESVPLADQLDTLLLNMPDVHDRRDVLGKVRGGRLKAAEIAERVRDLAIDSH